MAPFDLTIPERGASAVMVEVPHGGTDTPAELGSMVLASEYDRRRDADLFVDDLYANAPAIGAAFLRTGVSRYVVDLNRSADDVDPDSVEGASQKRATQPRGVIWRVTTEGKPVLPAPLSAEELRLRIERYHAPYHNALRTTLDALRERFGYALLVAAHSMPSVGRAGHTDPGGRRADVVPGTQGRTSAHPAFIDLVDAHFRAAGLSVRHDDPYRGGYTTQHYGRPREGIHVVQIELSRALYMNEETCEKKPGDFERLQKLLDELVAKLVLLKL